MQVLAIWGFFAGLIVGTLMVDALRYMDKPQPLSLRESAAWTGSWVGLAALFGVAVFVFNGTDKGMEFVKGYIIEWSVSVGLLLMFLMIFRYFRVPDPYRRQVLFWGIVGAIVLRGVFLYGEAGKMSHFAWAVYASGALLVYAGGKLMGRGDAPVGARMRPAPRPVQRILPGEATPAPRNSSVRRNGKRESAVLVPVILSVAATDILVTVGSTQAILGITQDPFIVYSANLYAILGLRALFCLLAGIMGMLRFLQAGVCLGLVIVGAGVIISGIFPLPGVMLLGVVAAVLAGSVVASVLSPTSKGAEIETGEESPADSAGSPGKDTGEDEEEDRRAA